MAIIGRRISKKEKQNSFPLECITFLTYFSWAYCLSSANPRRKCELSAPVPAIVLSDRIKPIAPCATANSIETCVERITHSLPVETSKTPVVREKTHAIRWSQAACCPHPEIRSRDFRFICIKSSLVTSPSWSRSSLPSSPSSSSSQTSAFANVPDYI